MSQVTETVEDLRAQVRQSIASAAKIDASFLIMNGLATIVAAYGLLLDSVAVVIGAMIIATLLGPIMGIALALVDGDDRLLRAALIAEGIGVALVFGLAFLVGAVHAELPLTTEILARAHPNLMDLMVALAGGAAGAYATVSPKVSVGLVGVAISTALVPPLAASGICLAHGRGDLALGAFLLFFANLVAIQFASSIMLWAHGLHQIAANLMHPLQLLRRGLATAVLLVALAVGLGLNFRATVSEQVYLGNLRTTIERHMAQFAGVRVLEVTSREREDRNVVTAIVRSPYSFTPESVSRLESLLPRKGDLQTELHLRAVLTKETSAEGYLHERAVDLKEVQDTNIGSP